MAHKYTGCYPIIHPKLLFIERSIPCCETDTSKCKADIVVDCSPFPAVSLWPPESPSLPSDSGDAADPPVAAGELSEALVAPSHCRASAQHNENRIENYINITYIH